MKTLRQQLTRSVIRMHWKEEMSFWHNAGLYARVRRAWCMATGAHCPGVIVDDRRRPIGYYCPKCRVRTVIPVQG